jgi:hypothetical protein
VLDLIQIIFLFWLIFIFIEVTSSIFGLHLQEKIQAMSPFWSNVILHLHLLLSWFKFIIFPFLLFGKLQQVSSPHQLSKLKPV